jgi:type I restriction enzyme M protein
MELLTTDCDVHTLLRLPNGTFTPYSPSTKTNVVFLTKGPATENIWVYDARTNIPHITKQARPLTAKHFEEFEKCFGQDPYGRSKRKPADSKRNRWRSFSIDQVRALKFKLEGLRWLQEEQEDDLTELQEPEELATEALTEIRLAADDLSALIAELSEDGGDAMAANLARGDG